METEISEAGRALVRRLWQLGTDVREAWAMLSGEDRRLLANELRGLARQAEG